LNCHCGNKKAFEDCCLPFITFEEKPETPEQLMRSRYSAYCTQNYRYIFNTYANAQQKSLSVEDIASSAEDTIWTALSVCSTSMDKDNGLVEFKAYYRVGSRFFVLHEVSKFIKQNNDWRYTTGDIQSNSGQLDIKRNESCPCLSKLKYKRCCGR
jgi:SEC-C motif-containing protein